MILKRIPFFVFFLFLYVTSGAIPQYAFRIMFTDKAGAPGISTPLDFLSQRALDRRSAQGIAVTDNDRPVSQLYIDTVLLLTEGKLHVTSRWLNSCVILLTDTSKIALLQNKPYISGTRLVAYYPAGLHKGGNTFPPEKKPGSSHKTTGDPAFYGATYQQTNFVHGDCLHDLGFKGQDKLIAVLDDGFDYVNTNPAFDSLYTSGRILDRHNFVLADTGVFGYNAHGTQVLSTMAVYMPGSYVGAAPLAQYALYITEDQGSEQPVEMDNIVAGFERADSLGADIISSSLGYNVFTGAAAYNLSNSELDGKTTPAAQAVNLAAEKGMLMVISMGNEGSGGLLTPGDADSALTIGNVDVNKVPAGNSGYGPNGAGVVKPDVCALGAPAAVLSSGLNPYFVNGTSMSTPQVAGFAACLWQSAPGKTSYQIRSAIQKSGDHYASPVLPQLGYGVPDFCVALHSLDVTDIDDKSGGIQVYPNPFSDELRLSASLKVEAAATVLITDITGRTVVYEELQLRRGQNDRLIPLPLSLSPGVYVCRVVMGTQARSLKLLRK